MPSVWVVQIVSVQAQAMDTTHSSTITSCTASAATTAVSNSQTGSTTKGATGSTTKGANPLLSACASIQQFLPVCGTHLVLLIN